MSEDEIQLDPAEVAALLAGANERLRDHLLKGDLRPDSREEIEARIRALEAKTEARGRVAP